jgi:hypothetical protein
MMSQMAKAQRNAARRLFAFPGASKAILINIRMVAASRNTSKLKRLEGTSRSSCDCGAELATSDSNPG